MAQGDLFQFGECPYVLPDEQMESKKAMSFGKAGNSIELQKHGGGELLEAFPFIACLQSTFNFQQSKIRPGAELDGHVFHCLSRTGQVFHQSSALPGLVYQWKLYSRDSLLRRYSRVCLRQAELEIVSCRYPATWLWDSAAGLDW